MPFTLLIAEGNGRGRRFRFAGESVAIGRGTENDVVLNDAAVSRAHARIERRGAAWVLLDRASANGTQLNGAALAAAAALRDGDRIRVGVVTFEFRGTEHRTSASVAGRSRLIRVVEPAAAAGARRADRGVHPGGRRRVRGRLVAERACIGRCDAP